MSIVHLATRLVATCGLPPLYCGRGVFLLKKWRRLNSFVLCMLLLMGVKLF
jgi:hypothetical protein